MTMPADNKKDPCNGEETEHLLPRFRSRVAPPFYTCVHTFRQVIHFRDIEPGDIFPINIIIGKRGGTVCFRGTSVQGRC